MSGVPEPDFAGRVLVCNMAGQKLEDRFVHDCVDGLHVRSLQTGRAKLLTDAQVQEWPVPSSTLCAAVELTAFDLPRHRCPPPLAHVSAGPSSCDTPLSHKRSRAPEMCSPHPLAYQRCGHRSQAAARHLLRGKRCRHPASKLCRACFTVAAFV